MDDCWIPASWEVPDHVQAGVTTRFGGVSRGAFAEFNLADHVGDDPGAVADNRRRLVERLRLPAVPQWLEQCHGSRVVNAAESGPVPLQADASFSCCKAVVCAVLTADCLPIVMWSAKEDRVTAVHAGWRGMVAGVVENALAHVCAADTAAWLGPSIGGDHYEVGPEVRAAFVQCRSTWAQAFRRGRGDRWYLDLAKAARQALREAGVRRIWGGDLCTFEDRRFYSFRRDGRTGRMASLIWLSP